MAMLAEPRKKVKYSIDPRGTNWSNDDSKFGQKLMEKMGWAKGKGLGANEDGKTDHVKVTYKMDNRGVGCSNKHADNWIAHQDDFNSLLANLNADQGKGTEEEDSGEKDKVSGLEASSKNSKARVHYQRFTKGKDLSGKKRDDLDCIFGRRKSKSEPCTPNNQSEVNSDAEEAVVPEGGLITITSTDSIQQYFAKKMADLKRQRENPGSPAVESSATTSDEPVEGTASSEEENIEKKKKKKSKKRKRDSEDDDEEDNSKRVKFSVGDDTGEESSEKESVSKKEKKSKKKKNKEKEIASSEDKTKNDKIDVSERNSQFAPPMNYDDPNVASNTGDVENQESSISGKETGAKKVKKSKKKKNKEKDEAVEDKSENVERNAQFAPPMNYDEPSTETDNQASAAAEESTETDLSVSKKSKKKKKKKQETETNDINLEEKEMDVDANIKEEGGDCKNEEKDTECADKDNEADEKKKRKKRKKKSKDAASQLGFEGVNLDKIPGYLNNFGYSGDPKKKKKKPKRRQARKAVIKDCLS